MKKYKWQIGLIVGLVIIIIVMVVILVRGNRAEREEINSDLSITPTNNGQETTAGPEVDIIPAPVSTATLSGQVTVSTSSAQTIDIGRKPAAARWEEGLGKWWFNRENSGQTLNCIDEVCRWRATLESGTTYPAFFLDYEAQKDNLVAIAESYLRNFWGFNKIVLMPESEKFYFLGGETSTYYLSEVLDPLGANAVSWSWYWENNGQIMAWKNMPAAQVTITTTGNLLNITITDMTPVSVTGQVNTQRLLTTTELLDEIEEGKGEWLNSMGLLDAITRTEIKRQEIVWVSDEESSSVPYYYLSGVFSDGVAEQKNTVVLK